MKIIMEIRGVKCQYCGNEKEILRSNQKYFTCCDKKQLIGSRTLISQSPNVDNSDDKQTASSVEKEESNKEPVKSSSEESSDNLQKFNQSPVQNEQANIQENKKEENNIMEPEKMQPEASNEQFEVEEPKPEEKINPDDWDYKCNNCKELFNEAGNIKETENGKVIVCPDCKEEYPL